MLRTFADDERVVVWDLYNEPGNVGMGDKSLPLVEAAFTWAREATPRQPLTVAVWNEELANLNEAQLALSDVISFHVYTDYAGMVERIERYSTHNRPLLCTEWMARARASSFDRELPLFKSKKVGCYSWGLVNGRMQTHFPWDNKPGGTVDPETGWFHDIFHQDGTPYRPEEIEAIRRNTADLKS
jgi:hypothetical protein